MIPFWHFASPDGDDHNDVRDGSPRLSGPTRPRWEGGGVGGGLAGTLNAWSTLRPSPLKLALKAAGSPTEYVQTGTIEYSRCVVDQIIGLKTLYTVKVFDWTE